MGGKEAAEGQPQAGLRAPVPTGRARPGSTPLNTCSSARALWRPPRPLTHRGTQKTRAAPAATHMQPSRWTAERHKGTTATAGDGASGSYSFAAPRRSGPVP